jgi:hypothetical protein
MGKTTSEPISSIQPSHGDGGGRQEKRRAANRRSARKSRYREVVMLDELQCHSQELALKNSTLRQENTSLRSMIASIKKSRAEQPEVPRAGGMVRSLSFPALVQPS